MASFQSAGSSAVRALRLKISVHGAEMIGAANLKKNGASPSEPAGILGCKDSSRSHKGLEWKPARG